MKQLFTMAILMAAISASGQSAFNFDPFSRKGIQTVSKTTQMQSDEKGTTTAMEKKIMDFSQIPRLGIAGIGNLNTETFKEVNASGKLSGYIRPYRNTSKFMTVYFGFNINATNSDSLMASTFLFPDIGRNNFNIGADFNFVLASTATEAHIMGPFAEFATKNIKVKNDKDEYSFSTLNFQLGGRYQYYTKEGNDIISLTAAAYMALVNVPNEDNEDYRFLFTKDMYSTLKSTIPSFGIKCTFQINQLQFFADMRHTFGSEQNVPVRALRGFNSNVGMVFNASFFER